MISDILSDAGFEINEWLKNKKIYSGKNRKEIKKLISQMEFIRKKLDMVPNIKIKNNKK